MLSLSGFALSINLMGNQEQRSIEPQASNQSAALRNCWPLTVQQTTAAVLEISRADPHRLISLPNFFAGSMGLILRLVLRQSGIGGCWRLVSAARNPETGWSVTLNPLSIKAFSLQPICFKSTCRSARDLILKGRR
jgi:hypothetical protein